MLVDRWPAALCQATRDDRPVEAVFQALDGHDWLVDDRVRHVEVYGIFDDGQHRWVQLALDGNPGQMITLRLREDDRADCLLVSVAPRIAA